MFNHYDLPKLPEIIAEFRVGMLATARALNEAKAEYAEVLADIDLAIASDATLTNDAKRKGARSLATKTHSQLKEIQCRIDALTEDHAKEQILLDFYRDELRVGLALSSFGID
jgi:hypothetical protein